MATLEDLLKEYGLSEQPAQIKTASPVKQASQKSEVDQVLEGLGLSGAEEGVEKVASETDNKGDRMSLTGIYEELFGETSPEGTTPAEGEGTEKVANAEEVSEATQLFGELTAHYFGVAQGQFVEKVAGSVEAESDQDDEQPMQHMGNNSQLTNTIGKPSDPHMPVNHSASGGAKLDVTTGNTSPYSLKEKALAKAILKRLPATNVGAMKD